MSCYYAKLALATFDNRVWPTTAVQPRGKGFLIMFL